MLSDCLFSFLCDERTCLDMQCRYDKSYCSEAAQRYKEAGAINNIYYCLGYDYDSVYPGASVLMLMLKLNPEV